jgi:hypothetical protein
LTVTLIAIVVSLFFGRILLAEHALTNQRIRR